MYSLRGCLKVLAPKGLQGLGDESQACGEEAPALDHKARPLPAHYFSGLSLLW